jgi:sterol desaturase/sphingolipid hydroxylase (fatty acid hydroxylase superfamily)
VVRRRPRRTCGRRTLLQPHPDHGQSQRVGNDDICSVGERRRRVRGHWRRIRGSEPVAPRDHPVEQRDALDGAPIAGAYNPGADEGTSHDPADVATDDTTHLTADVATDDTAHLAPHHDTDHRRRVRLLSAERHDIGATALTISLLERPSAADVPVGSRSAAGRRLSWPSVALAVGTASVLWVGLATLVHSGQLSATLRAGWMELAAPLVLGLVAVVLVCERLWPAERREALARGHVHDACFLALHLVAVVPLMILLSVAFARIFGGLHGWITLPWTSSWPLWSVLTITLVLMDGGNWLAHWADHQVGMLWRMHALHHTQEEVNVLTSFRAHPLSHFMGFFLATIPVIVVMGDRPFAPVLITAYVCLGTLTHANVRWSFGPLGKVLVSPAYHRLHHSVDASSGVNLGIVLTVWDVLAGRAQFPEPGAAPCRTGLAGRPIATEQGTPTAGHLPLLLNQLLEPFAVEANGAPPAGRPLPRRVPVP